MHARGVYMTTSYFSSGAKQMLEKLSDRFVGYDGDDLYETAKECSFGLKEVNGVWKLDEELLSGEKAFFSML
jgi:restriction endonuclease Mrr